MKKGLYTCDEILILLGETVLGTIDETDREVVRLHVAECQSCAEELAKLKTLYGALEPLRLIRPDEGFERRVAAGILRAVAEGEKIPATDRPNRPSWRSAGLVPGLALAATGVLGLVVYVSYMTFFGGVPTVPDATGPSALTAGETPRLLHAGKERTVPELTPETVAEYERGAPAVPEPTPARGTEPTGRREHPKPLTAEEYWKSGTAGLTPESESARADGGIPTDFDAEYAKAMDKREVFQRRLAAFWLERRSKRKTAGPAGGAYPVNGGRTYNGWKDPKVEVDISSVEGGEEAVAEYAAFGDDATVFFLYETPPKTQDEVLRDLKGSGGVSSGDQ